MKYGYFKHYLNYQISFVFKTIRICKTQVQNKTGKNQKKSGSTGS